MAKRKIDDWKRLEKGELDALIFKHRDYYQIFLMIKGKRNRYIVDTLRDVKNIKNEHNLVKTETIEV